MNLISAITTAVLKQRMFAINQMRKHPLETQERVFKYLVEAAARTEFGKQYDFKSIKNYDQFKQRVPVVSYEEFYPQIERVLNGEVNVLWPGAVKNFSKSSGTTNNRSKYIPVTPESLSGCHYKAGTDMIALYLDAVPGTKVLNGKTLAMGGSLGDNPLGTAGTVSGDVSALIMNNLPWWAQRMRAPKIETALLTKWEEKIDRIVIECVNENITSLSGVPTWTVVLIQQLLNTHHKKSLKDIWPNLELFLHGAVSFGPYRELFDKLIPEGINYLENYNASEGYFGIQDDLNLKDELLLMLDHGIWYEFLPLEELGKPFPITHSLGEIVPGKNYAIVISTNGGLWRYLLGDTVRFTSATPYRVKITGRTKHFINTFGEELIIENAEIAVSEACKATDAIMLNYTAAPVYMEVEHKKGGHEWVIEFEKDPVDLEKFKSVLDEQLRKVNSDYDAKRYKNMALLPPILRMVPTGTFNKWLKRKGKMGGQHKIPRLSNNRELVEEILQII